MSHARDVSHSLSLFSQVFNVSRYFAMCEFLMEAACLGTEARTVVITGAQAFHH
jgi:hypothetical protein